MAIAHAPGAAAAGSSAGAVHTFSIPPVSPREHKMLGWQKDGLAEQWVHPAIYKEVMEQQAVGHTLTVGHGDAAGMLCPMDAARRCEIVADNTQAPVKQTSSQNVWLQIDQLKLCEALFQKTACSFCLRRQPRNSENMTLVARWREHFRGFWAVFLLLNSLKKGGALIYKNSLA